MTVLTDEIRQAIHAQLTTPPAGPANAKARDYKFKPWASESLGVHPSQVAEATEALRANGVTADFDKEGRCLITSEKQFRDVARAAGLFHGRDGYGAKDSDGRTIYTGRELQRKRNEFRQAVLRGEIDLG